MLFFVGSLVWGATAYNNTNNHTRSFIEWLLCSFHAARRKKNELFLGGGRHGVVGADVKRNRYQQH